MNVAIGVPEKVEQRALAAVAAHPLHAEAKSWTYCVNDVFEEAKTFVERLRLTDEEKAAKSTNLTLADRPAATHLRAIATCWP